MLTQEIEIKLDLQSSENYDRLIKQLGISGNPSRQENYFYDTSDWALSKNGWALRIRKEKAKSTISLKGTSSHSSDGLTIRSEVETPIEEKITDEYYNHGIKISQIPDVIREIIFPIINSECLLLKLKFVNYRYHADFCEDNLKVVFEIDQTVFSDGSIDYELEVELGSQLDGQKALGAITSFLGSLHIKTMFQEKSKFARALAAENINLSSNPKRDYF